MPLNGSGTYNPPEPEYPAIPNTVILASDFNTIISDIASALGNAVYRDGQSTIIANIPFNNKKITGLGNGVNPNDAVNFNQVFVNPHFTATSPTGVNITGTKLTVSTNDVAITTVANIDLTGDMLNGEFNEFHFTGGAQLTIDSDQTIIQGDYYEITTTDSVLQSDIISVSASSSISISSPVINLTGLTTASLSTASTGVTQSLGDNSTKVATTAYVDATALSVTFPVGVGNDKKVLGQLGGVPVWTNKVYTGQFFISDSTDSTKTAQFNVSGFPTATNRSLILPNANTTLVGIDTAQTLTNKTIVIDDDKLTVQDGARPTTKINLNLNRLPLGVTRQVYIDDELSGDVILGNSEWKLISTATSVSASTNIIDFVPAIFDSTYSIYKLEIENLCLEFGSAATQRLQVKDTSNTILTTSIYYGSQDSTASTSLRLSDPRSGFNYTLQPKTSVYAGGLVTIIVTNWSSSTRYKGLSIVLNNTVMYNDGFNVDHPVTSFQGNINTTNALKSFIINPFGANIAAGYKLRWYGKAN